MAAARRSPEELPRIAPDRTTFVGRVRELAELRCLFGGATRLVTITGPPGIGKTRLAMSYARQLQDDAAARSSVRVCSLVESRTLDDLIAVVAGGLDVLLDAGTDRA